MESVVGVCRSLLGESTLFNPRLTVIRNLNKFKSVKKPFFGVPPYEGKSLAQKLEEMNYKDPNVYYKVNIGLPHTVSSRASLLEERKDHLKKLRNDHELEKKARENKLSLCLEEVSKEWVQESAPAHIKNAAEHYNIFSDLFEDAFFYPNVNLDVVFKHDENLVPVYRGNLIKPSQALSAPQVMYSADPNTLWTLVVTNPDGHVEEENGEYLHWLVGNIPGNDLNKGNVVADYVQPFPTRGTGFQRFVIILYKQTEKIDYSNVKKASDQIHWKHRTFRTYDFYWERQDHLTPAGLAFCQVDWDDSVSKFFHTVLDMEEPVYEYDFAPPFYTKQKMFPIKQPFNLYLDRYRDPKEIAKEYILKKLKNRHPFRAPKPPLKYPNAVPVYHDLDQNLYGRVPSWLKLEKLKERMGYGRVNDY